MAITAFTVLDRAVPKLVDGTIDLNSHTFNLVLTDKDQVISKTFAGASTDARYADLTDEVANGAGYTTGGTALANVTLTRTLGVVKFDADDVVFSSLTKTFKYGVLVDITAANDDIVGFVDFDDTSSATEITVSGTNYTVAWNASGIFTVTRTTPA